VLLQVNKEVEEAVERNMKQRFLDGFSCEALFSSKIFCKTGTVALSFVCDKYCPIMD